MAALFLSLGESTLGPCLVYCALQVLRPSSCSYRGHVVQGVYPAKFLDEWRQYKKAEPQKALNLCPGRCALYLELLPLQRLTLYSNATSTDTFGPTQYYLVLCLPYGGVDLETSKLHSWTHAASILWQVAYGLATAERSWHFEVSLSLGFLACSQLSCQINSIGIFTGAMCSSRTRNQRCNKIKRSSELGHPFPAQQGLRPCANPCNAIYRAGLPV